MPCYLGRDNDRKRESSSAISSVTSSKKLKVNIPGRTGISGPLTSSVLSSERAPSGIEPWESLTAECDPESVLEVVMNHIHSGCVEKAVNNKELYSII